MTAEPSRQRPLPDTNDPILYGFFEGTKKGELSVQNCQDCSSMLWPPRVNCPRCASFSMGWTATNGKGNLFSWSRIHHTVLPYFAAKAPYVVAIIQLDDVPVRMIGELRSGNDTHLRLGTQLVVSFEDLTPDCTLPYWTPAVEEPPS